MNSSINIGKTFVNLKCGDKIVACDVVFEVRGLSIGRDRYRIIARGPSGAVRSIEAKSINQEFEVTK